MAEVSARTDAAWTSGVPADCRARFESWDGAWPLEPQPVLGTRDGVLARVESWAALAAIRTCGALPSGMLAGAIRAVARLARRIDKRHTGEARDYLRAALGEMDEDELDERVLQAYAHFLRVIVDSGRMQRKIDFTKLLEHLDYEVAPELWDYCRSGKPMVFAAPHLGDWETAGAVVPRLGFTPFYAFARPPKNLPLSRVIQAERTGRGLSNLPRRGGLKDGLAVLERGGNLGMMVDQRSHGRFTIAQVFGRPALSERGVGVMLRRARAPVAIIAMVYGEELYRYRLLIPRVFSPDEIQDLGAERLTQAIQDEFEALILRYPEQYMWLHGRYRGADEALAASEG